MPRLPNVPLLRAFAEGVLPPCLSSAAGYRPFMAKKGPFRQFRTGNNKRTGRFMPRSVQKRAKTRFAVTGRHRWPVNRANVIERGGGL